MIRMAGVRRAEDRDDHMVHAVGLGFTEIDAEMRESMAKNEALAEALAMAEEANKAKTAFLSNMSHEIRTPMNAIIGLDNLALHDETISPQTRDYLEKIGGSARHLLELINDILDMSRIESGRLVLRKEEFSFSAMLEQINTMVMSQCADKGLDYECRILSPVDDYYIGDDMKLKEVLINILSNAIKFTDAPGSVTLTVERIAVFEDQSTLRFCIKDTGIGMDKEFIPKIFDAFSQEDGSRKNKYGSTGLGMAITKNIVEMMNGTIAVESEKGVGTEFTVVVTLRNAAHRTPTAGSVDLTRMRVLVVDDEEIAAEHARMVLDEAGIRADVCMSGEEALRMLEVQNLKQEPYNLVLLDRNMPGMDGMETARLIRERYDNETTVIILTAYNWDDVHGGGRKRRRGQLPRQAAVRLQRDRRVRAHRPAQQHEPVPGKAAGGARGPPRPAGRGHGDQRRDHDGHPRNGGHGGRSRRKRQDRRGDVREERGRNLRRRSDGRAHAGDGRSGGRRSDPRPQPARRQKDPDHRPDRQRL